MTAVRNFIICLFLCLAGPNAIAFGDIFFVGNSLTWDSRPMLLDQPADYHIRAGRNLQHMYDNPHDLSPASAVSWETALNSKQYDTIVVQPHFGTTLEQDIFVIGEFLKLQPNAELLIHTGWSRHEEFREDYDTLNHNGLMVHSPAYFDALEAGLEFEFSDRTINRTRHIDVFNEIYQDVENGVAPFGEFSHMYRDTIHMTIFEGRYLAHNLLRESLGMPLSRDGFQTRNGELKFPESHRAYYNSKIFAVPEPSTLVVVSVTGLLGFARRRRL